MFANAPNTPLLVLMSFAVGLGSADPARSACCTPITAEHVFLFEDSAQILQPFVQVGTTELAKPAIDALVLTYGNVFDFVVLSHTVGGGGGLHQRIWNDVEGIGFAVFDGRPGFGLLGDRVQSLIGMSTLSDHGNPQNAITHEFMHRWVVGLPPLPGDRPLMSPTNPGHFYGIVDLNGGAHGTDWVGDEGNARKRNNAGINTDFGGRITGLGLYLMGAISADELDTLVSERRYMDEYVSSSTGNYTGPISTWSSADIVQTAGPRVPAAGAADVEFRAAWILVYQPGELGTNALNNEINKIVSEINTFAPDWHAGSLQRSSIEFQLFPDANSDGIPDYHDCNDNGLPDADDIAEGRSFDCDGNGRPDECDLLGQPPSDDCNCNGIPDTADIALQFSFDCNRNVLPDECEPDAVIPPPDGDLMIDLRTNGRDLPAFIDALLNDPGDKFAICAADFDGSGQIDPGDIGAFVAALLGS